MPDNIPSTNESDKINKSQAIANAVAKKNLDAKNREHLRWDDFQRKIRENSPRAIFEPSDGIMDMKFGLRLMLREIWYLSDEVAVLRKKLEKFGAEENKKDKN